MIRKDLLIDLLSVQTTSGNEYDMIAHIHNFCRQNVPDATVKIKDNNIYVTKGYATILSLYCCTHRYSTRHSQKLQSF